MRKTWRYFLLFSLLIVTNCFALQKISIADDQTKNVTISAYELSRIFVKGDRIQNVRGLEGAYILTKDAAQGQIYIKPTPPYQSKPFNLFITTEQGHNYNLFVMASGLPGQDVELKPNTPSKEAGRWEKNMPYSQALVQLITAMVNGDPPQGYAVLYPAKKTKDVEDDTYTLRLQRIYQGVHLTGKTYLVQNKTDAEIVLDKQYFYQNGVRAIAFFNPKVAPNGQTMLYMVTADE